jgi:hypothetical protein
MDTYVYEVLLKVEIPAFSEDDAQEVIEDAFGLGENCGARVYERTVTPLGPSH